ncbi:hypothetical protein [Synechococcus sp. CBW1006]|uniref:hypothetical protein n=1 Tax=Synechococcus sp. CBW1006 TaxID=1353138 RepID=UPI0018CF6002|nr:hypothetical protein [Synechococcus sp. CBW1006]QPN65867.1 hypothetical protein H8F26_13355 [Synechococcus sp. CBW1006]
MQRSLRHDHEGAFRLLYYGLALRGLEALPARERLVPPESEQPPRISVLIPVHNHWAITLNTVSGCGLAIRTELWQQLGGFVPRYRPAYSEDTDLCLHLERA